MLKMPDMFVSRRTDELQAMTVGLRGRTKCLVSVGRVNGDEFGAFSVKNAF